MCAQSLTGNKCTLNIKVQVKVGGIDGMAGVVIRDE